MARFTCKLSSALHFKLSFLGSSFCTYCCSYTTRQESDRSKWLASHMMTMTMRSMKMKTAMEG